MATEKQKAAARKILENPGSVSAAMRDVGYSESTAHNPSDLTKSKGWQELMEQYYPDDKIAKLQQKMLKAAILRHDTFDLTYTEKEIRKVINSAGGKVTLIKKVPPVAKTKSEKKREGYWMVYFTVPDQRIVDATMDKILKSKGKYVSKIEVDDKRKYGGFSDEQLRRIIDGESSDAV